MTARPRSETALACVAALLASCGSEGGGRDPRDVEAPVIRSVRASLDDRASFDLDREDVERIVSGVTPLELIVDVRDADTPLAALEPSVDDESGGAAPELARELRSGLWRLSGSVRPGQTLRVRVTDPGGNASAAAHALRIPTLAEALAGAWQTPLFDPDQSIRARWHADWTREGTWTETREDTGGALVGDFAADEAGGLAITVRDGGPVGDGDPSTPDERTTANPFVDELVFAHRPYSRVEGDAAEGLVGAWTRDAVIALPDGEGALVDALAESQTLRFFADGGYREERTSADLVAGSPPETELVEGGWRVEPPDSYMGTVGAFLEVTPEDGPATFVLYAIRGDRLLLSPAFREEAP